MVSNNDSDPKKNLNDLIHQKLNTLSFCSKHGKRFPVGEKCPACEAEERARSERNVP